MTAPPRPSSDGWVVFLRGANVGGRIFRPSQLAQELPALGLVSIGAAGTFVARTQAAAGTVRSALQAKLPFQAAIMVTPAREIDRLLRAGPPQPHPLPPGVRNFVCVARAPLSNAVRLPIEVPSPSVWGVRVLAIDRQFAMGVCRRIEPRMVYPNEVVERAFGVETTTRWWETLEAIGRILSDTEAGPGGRGVRLDTPVVRPSRTPNNRPLRSRKPRVKRRGSAE
ncbi:MAG: hypothetical protein WBG19_09350 [Thermoplasmata archaeon]